MEPADFYGVRGAGFTSLRRELGWLSGDPHPHEEALTCAIGAALLHLDDPDRLRATAAALALLWQASARCACTAATTAPRSKPPSS